MAKGSLKLAVVDLLDAAIGGELEVEFEPVAGSPGGVTMEVKFATAGPRSTRNYARDTVLCSAP